jgi:serine-type D-Ala-D-Ala carboxypeptidase/endopeptidase (penicillin-binding protein 4)
MRMMFGMKLIAFILLTFCAMPAALAQDAATLQKRIEAQLSAASPGTRFGIVVSDPEGREVISINPEGRFIPASNTKIVTTAAAFMALPALDKPDTDGGARVWIERGERRKVYVVLEGRGDARLSSASDCVINCLSTLADAVAASVRKVQDVIGDDTHFSDERWSPGMSWNNISSKSGTAASALSLDDNEIMMTVTPGALRGPPSIMLSPYFTIDNQAITTADGPTTISFDRAPNGMTVRISGKISASAPPERIVLGIDNPAHYAAWRFREMLVERGVKVKGAIKARHRVAIFESANAAPLAQLTPPPLIEDLTTINKVSQNLHAELMLRRLGAQSRTGSIEDGLSVVRTMFGAAGVLPRYYHFADGSGMSTYNRIAPRGMVTLLRWIAAQPWGAQWRATLPVGGEGMLARRYAGTALAGRIFAKTGTLNATSALSGMMIGKSGRTLTFAAFANDIPEGDNASRAVDAALLAIAEAS